MHIYIGKRRNETNKDKDVHDHSVIQLQKTDCKSNLMKNQKTQDDDTMMPDYCWDCGDEF